MTTEQQQRLMTTWTVAYNHPTQSWSAGGSLSEYERPHWDLYQVEAASRGHAEAAAKAMRRKQCDLTSAQAKLLASLRAEHETTADGVRKECPWVMLDEAEVRTARGLAAKGLVALREGDDRQVRLTVCAFNQNVEAMLKRHAADGEARTRVASGG